MRTMTILSKGLLTILIITVCIFFAASWSTANPIFKSIGKLKMSKVKKQTYTAPLILVSVPLKIMDVPEPWRNAELVVESYVLFWLNNNKGYAEGYSIGQVIKPQALANGSYQGVVYVPITEVTGIITGQYYTYSIAVAKRGNECKILGWGCNIEGKGCPDNVEDSVDMIIPWTDPIMENF